MKINMPHTLLLLLLGIITSAAFAQHDTFTDPRDEEIYPLVKIGGQTWMAENLRYDTENSWKLKVKKNKYQVYFDGSFKGAKECGTSDEYGVKAIDCEHLEKVGVYYPWEDANDACPNGWHLASSEEWEQLFNYVTETYGPFEDKTPLSSKENQFIGVGKTLKGKYWSINDGLKDETGFAALPDGNVNRDHVTILGQEAHFWTSTQLAYGGKKVNGYHYNIVINLFHDNAAIEDGMDSRGRSVRCVKN
jgi:uncharacterized protein (TIGR02145 family)